MNNVTSDDKLWAALSWVIPLVGVIVLFMEEKKNRPFIKYHAVNSLAFNVVFFVLLFVISFITFGFGGCLGILWFISLYWAYKAYQGETFEIPVLTNFVKGQGWA
jgi:uncharacterized membrane protein